MPRIPRVETIVLDILRSSPDLAGVTVNTWTPLIDFRSLPLITVQRIGGTRNITLPRHHAVPFVELVAYGKESYGETVLQYEAALDALIDAVHKQTLTQAGYLSSFHENMGATKLESPFTDSWRIQGILALGVRPLRKPLP